MSVSLLDSVRSRAEQVREAATAQPYTVASVCAASASVLASGFAYWRLRAKQHPSVPSVDLPMHHFSGHVPSMQEAMKKKQWLQTQERIINDGTADEYGIVCVALPNITISYLHFVTDPDLIKYLWTELDIPKAMAQNETFEEIFGYETIFSVSGDDWHSHRNVLTAMFTRRNLKNFMFDCGSRASQRVVSLIESRMTDNSVSLDIFDLLGRFTLDSFVEIALGQKCESIEAFPEPFEFGMAMDRTFEHSAFRFRDPFWKVKKYFQIGSEKQMTDDVKCVYDFMDEMLNLEMRRNIFDATGVDKYDLVSIYLRSMPELNQSQLRHIAMSMIIAGRDTTRNLLAWTLAVLCTSQKEWLAKITEEIQAIKSDELSYEECQQSLKLTECVLLETLRLYPAVTSSTRQLHKDLVLPNGIKLFKGEIVQVNHYAQARNKSIYGEDASEFKPMRWDEKGLSTFPSHVFGAFHIHPRICLGRYFALTEAKTLLFYFLRTFNYRSEGDLFPRLPVAGLLMMEDGWQVEITSKQ